MVKLRKLISIFMVVAIMVMAFAPMAFAAAGGAPDPASFTGDTSAQTERITGLGNKVITIISVIGSVVSVVILIVIGVKYMMGSAEERAEYKKTLMPYVIGAVLVFAASTIAGMVFQFASSI